MPQSHSLLRRLLGTSIAAIAFASLYQVTTLDSKYAARQAVLRETTALPAPGAQLRFSATAYCKGTTTASGVAVRTGIAAADPQLLPGGSVILIDSLEPRYNGIYTVMDTGAAVRGRHIDIFMWSCNEAIEFGVRSIRVTVLRLGWNPRASAPGAANELFRRREEAQSPPSPPFQPVEPTEPAAPESGTVQR